MPRPIRQLCAVLLLTLPAACRGADERATTVDSANGEVAFNLTGPGGAVLIVPVYLNGSGPYDFIFDTGATLTCVDESLAAKLKLPDRFAQVGVGTGVSGAGQVRIVRIDTVRTGSAKEKAIEACVLDLTHLRALGPNVDGLLGLNFLKDYRVTIDFARKVVTFDR